MLKSQLDDVRHLAVWCQKNNLSLNVCKTMELIMDYRKRRAEHAPIHIDKAVAEWVEIFKFLGVHQQTIMVLTHQDSREEGTTMPVPPLETEKIWHGSPNPYIVRAWLHQIKSNLFVTYTWLASPPGMATARHLTVRHYRGEGVRPSTSLGPSFLPSRTSIPGSVRGRP